MERREESEDEEDDEEADDMGVGGQEIKGTRTCSFRAYADSAHFEKAWPDSKSPRPRSERYVVDSESRGESSVPFRGRSGARSSELLLEFAGTAEPACWRFPEPSPHRPLANVRAPANPESLLSS